MYVAHAEVRNSFLKLLFGEASFPTNWVLAYIDKHTDIVAGE
jgi:hypothetical protein